MSQPKRYDVGMREESHPTGLTSRWPWVYSSENGRYVEWDDYAALAAENERLRKAGDAMMEVLESEIPFTAMNAVNGWLAAKEGRDAK